MQSSSPTQSREHLSGYQARDYEIVDYQMYELPGTGLWFRGPPPASMEAGSYFACIGAAQTFGCFCSEPYPDLVAKQIGLPALNLGYGGAGPEFFLRQERLLGYINRARFCVLQVMSARSQSNSYYDCGGLEYVTLRDTGEKLGAAEAFDRLLSGPYPMGGKIGRKLSRLVARPRVRALVTEIRRAWTDSLEALIDEIEVPTVMLWMSKRTPLYQESYTNSLRLHGAFPQLVTPEMLVGAQQKVAAYVESVSARGSPQPLISRFTGQPTTVETANDRPDLAGKPLKANRYYPSPEMQQDAATALLGQCAILAKRR
jgi:hypothetical protein